MEEHNIPFGIADWQKLFFPATQCGYTSLIDAITDFGTQDLCLPVGSKGGN